jgi:acyl-coenzyme A synthetase/AMP-(fatty) acid ligase
MGLNAGVSDPRASTVDGVLAPFKVPKRVHVTEELPRDQSGKLLKRVLRDRL